jgi:hypothetical protein
MAVLKNFVVMEVDSFIVESLLYLTPDRGAG